MKPWPNENKVAGYFFDKTVSDKDLSKLVPAAKHFVHLKQTHSNVVALITDDNVSGVHEADASVTALENVALTIHTADCLPLLAYADNLIGACHGGWRGVTLNILEKWLSTLQAFGAKREDLQIAIGPAIGPCHFEVGSDVAQLLLQGTPEKFVNTFRRPHSDSSKAYISLREVARFRLMRSGVLPQNIIVSDDCTYCDADRFHSYRRDGAQKGHRLEAVIVKAHH